MVAKNKTLTTLLKLNYDMVRLLVTLNFEENDTRQRWDSEFKWKVNMASKHISNRGLIHVVA